VLLFFTKMSKSGINYSLKLILLQMFANNMILRVIHWSVKEQTHATCSRISCFRRDNYMVSMAIGNYPVLQQH